MTLADGRLVSSGTAQWTGNPNSAHQTWSHWKFWVAADPARLPTMAQLQPAVQRFFRRMFGSAGAARLTQVGTTYLVELRVEGPPAHDPACRDSVQRQFAQKVVAGGFGPRARLARMNVRFLAGDRQDGTPLDQVIVLPPLRLETTNG
jgi:hypothetical protein